ncbi:hypothetical protein [Aquimarina sp. SS2-1]|uniref:hypothetical protein n=1 Tax=Aquimarina besae TaxID=3342247 RepID=UPI003671B74D
MEIIKKNIQLLPFVLFLICVLFVNRTSLFDQQTKLNIAIGCAVGSVLFLILYWSKKENRESYKNNTIRGKIAVLVAAILVTAAIYVYQMMQH